ncbi:MAG: hypothetical protein M3419_06290 [Actinomycetota bacterium]|nr:hypothetical protein [Actinomycetota bacterium]
MNGSPSHRRFERLPEPVDLAATVSIHDPCPVPGTWVGRDTPLDLRQHEALDAGG